MTDSVNPQAQLYPPLTPLPVLLVGLLVASTSAIAVRFALAAGAAALLIAAFRLSLAALLLAPYALARHRPDLTRLKRNDWLIALAAGGCLGLHFAAWISSLRYTSVAASVTLVTTAPLWVALASRLFLGERLSRPVLIGLPLALAGGVLIALDGAGCAQGSACAQPLLGNLLALLGAIAYAGYLLLGRRLRASLSLAPYIFIVYSTGALALLAVVALSHTPPNGAPEALVWIALLAVGPQLIGHSSVNYALRYLPATLVAIVTLGEPLGASLLAFLLLHELPGAAMWVGGALILIGIASATRQADRS
ncbi:MAG TPA: DMT family transporter [Anaerolineae bacterium]|nr:DMT family transporter [Anaerolineae bacterium]